MKDAEDYTISMANKNLDDLSTQEEMANRHIKRLEFWTQFLKEMSKITDICNNISPSKDGWIPVALGITGVSMSIVITQTYARVEVFINRGNKEENKKIYDYFLSRKTEIENEFGSPLLWERMDDKMTSRIKFQLDGVNAFEKEDWPKINVSLIDATIRMEKVFKKEIEGLRRILR